MHKSNKNRSGFKMSGFSGYTGANSSPMRSNGDTTDYDKPGRYVRKQRWEQFKDLFRKRENRKANIHPDERNIDYSKAENIPNIYEPGISEEEKEKRRALALRLFDENNNNQFDNNEYQNYMKARGVTTESEMQRRAIASGQMLPSPPGASPEDFNYIDYTQSLTGFSKKDLKLIERGAITGQDIPMHFYSQDFQRKTKQSRGQSIGGKYDPHWRKVNAVHSHFEDIHGTAGVNKDYVLNSRNKMEQKIYALNDPKASQTDSPHRNVYYSSGHPLAGMRKPVPVAAGGDYKDEAFIQRAEERKIQEEEKRKFEQERRERNEKKNKFQRSTGINIPLNSRIGRMLF
jgi:hypothetical protein